MSKVRKSLVFSFGQNYIGFVLQFLSSIIISRLLTPADIGIYSIAMVFIGLAHRFRDFGAASYIIQEKELTDEKIRSAFAMTLITAWIMASALGLGSSYAAEFYREPGVKSVLLLLCLNFILLPFGSIPTAYMQRQMNFKPIALINIISSIVSALTSIIMAYMKFGYISLAVGAVVGTVCNVGLVQVWRPKGLPFSPGFKEIRKVFSFGSLSSFVMTLHDICEGSANLIIGRLSGMSMVGYLGRASGLVSMFERFVMTSLWSIALPHFAEQSRTTGVIRDSCLRSMTYLSVLAWPFFINLGLLAQPIITVLYGKQWEPSVLLLQLLCIAMLPTSHFFLLSSLMTAIGQMKQNLYALIVRLPVRVILIFFAARFGIWAIGATFIVSSLIDMIVNYLQCREILKINLKDISKALRESIGVACMSAAVPLALFLFGGSIPLWLQIILGLIGGAGGWLWGVFFFKHPLRTEIGYSITFIKKHMSFAK